MDQKSRPNFLIICTDQMRADHMGCAGNPVIRTPRLDALAAQGVNLSRAYVNNSLCMPGRVTVFTGLAPHGHRVRTNGIPLDRSIPTLPGALAEVGYHTASIGKVQLSIFGYGQNLDISYLPADRSPKLIEHWKAGRIKRIPMTGLLFLHVYEAGRTCYVLFWCGLLSRTLARGALARGCALDGRGGH